MPFLLFLTLSVAVFSQDAGDIATIRERIETISNTVENSIGNPIGAFGNIAPTSIGDPIDAIGNTIVNAIGDPAGAIGIIPTAISDPIGAIGNLVSSDPVKDSYGVIGITILCTSAVNCPVNY